ncbi:MAG: alpha/beta hydrolase [Lachnospiraceae bacterium]|nr:alpha/beta hydrolase [Lachnospiraceae bacterium]
MLRNQKKWKRVLIPIIAAAFVLFTFFWYVNDYYHSDERVQKYLQENVPVNVKEISDGLFLDGPGKESAMIFYPGAKVEYTAYLPLLYELAEQGVDCFLIKMPCNLAFLGQNKATDIMNEYQYKSWYLSGHSLGGAMAASYSAEHLKDLDGLVLLAAYPTKSLKSDTFSVVSIYGSEDGVLNMHKVKDGRSFMPFDYTEVCVEGGNHAWFGNYGEQEGDKTASISRDEQQQQAVEAILQTVNTAKDGKQ